jgi:CRISPR/Cas system-associated protein Cas5 (RAMP superfamily)
MANITTALGSMFGVIASTANTIGNGAESINDFVEQQRFKQKTNYVLERADFEAKAKEEKSKEITERRKELKRLRSDPEFAALYDEAYDELTTALDQHKAQQAKAR